MNATLATGAFLLLSQSQTLPSWRDNGGPVPKNIDRPPTISDSVNIWSRHDSSVTNVRFIEDDGDAESTYPEAYSEHLQEWGRVQHLNNYLGNIRDAGDIDPTTAAMAWDAWKALSEVTQRSLPVPDAAPGPNGELLYTWDKAEHHLELEFARDGSAEFFYRNRESGQLWGAEYTTGALLSQEVEEKLRIFI